MMCDFTGQPLDRIIEDSDRDDHDGPQALEYGLIDKVMERNSE